MNREFANRLAKATAHWLDYKRLSGFEKKLFSEALLIMPVIEFLFGHRYIVDAECDSATLFKFGGPGDFNYDIVARGQTQSPRSILLETKYLKGNDTRLYIDLLKLALPSNEQCPKEEWNRMLLVAGESEVLQKSKVIEKLMQFETMKLVLGGDQAKPYAENELDLRPELTTGELRKFKQKIEDRKLGLDNFKIDSVCAKSMDRKAKEKNGGGATESNQNVIVFSIIRS